MVRAFALIVALLLSGCAADQPSDRADELPLTATTRNAASLPSAGPAAYFSIELPKDWAVAEVEGEMYDERYRTFAVIQPNGSDAFTITVAVDGPRFIECWCAPLSEYAKYERDGIKYANLDMRDVRTLKAVGHHYGTDVHLSYDGRDKAILNKVVESIRPF